MDKTLMLAWLLVFVAAIAVVYSYIKQDSSYFDLLKDRMATLNAQNAQHLGQMKIIREENERLRVQFQDFSRMKSEIDMVLCQIRDVMAKELEFNRGAMNAHNNKFESMNHNYEKTRENIRQLDLICSELRTKQQPISVGPITVEIKTTEKKALGRGLNAILQSQPVKPQPKKSRSK